MDLSGFHITIAVTGLKTGDNPQPGVPVVRSLRAAGFSGKIIGFIYDALESGVYCDGLVDEVYQMPYPSSGADTFLSRIDYILSKSKMDVVIPTLDSEIPLYIRLKDELKNRGIHTFLPTEEQFNLRDKIKLSMFFPPKGISIPDTHILDDVSQIYSLQSKLQYPIIVKGRLYEAYKAYNQEEAVKYFLSLQEKWGLPVIVQEIVNGDEFNVLILGDGSGECLGMVPQRKLVITDKGKGFGGVVVQNKELEAYSRKVIQSLNWRGPCELEIIKGRDGNFYLIEINPRFPAWVRLAEGSGQNLPAATVLLALNKEVTPFSPCKTGTMFIRHAEDIITDIALMGELSVNGELLTKQEN